MVAGAPPLLVVIAPVAALGVGFGWLAVAAAGADESSRPSCKLDAPWQWVDPDRVRQDRPDSTGNTNAGRCCRGSLSSRSIVGYWRCQVRAFLGY